MTVHFIGAGPGAPDLLTLRGRDLIAACPVCLYAGSLVPSELLSYCPADAKIVNTASLSLDDDMFLRRRGTRACLQLAHKWESTALAAAVCELCRCPVLRVLVSSHPLCSSRDKLCPCVLFAFGRHSSRSSVQFCVAQPRLPDQSR